MMTVTAPAKLNLTLEVLGKYADGYHNIRSIVQTINLCDNLRFSASDEMNYICDLPEWEASRSLVSKAVSLLQSVSGNNQGARIDITKRIPLSSGLGGDSSDAVATLRGLNMLWGLKLSLPELLKMAAQLGSDLPLFLYGGTLLVEGRGEKVTPIRRLPHMSVMLLFPAVSVIENKTRQMYSKLKASDYTTGAVTGEFIKLLGNPGNRQVPGQFNVFDKIGLRFYRGLKEYREKFLEAGARKVHLSGSGPTLFTLVRDEVEAGNIYQRLQNKGLDAYLTDF